MFNQIPLYSRGRPLKNLIADWRKKWNDNSLPIVVNWGYDTSTPVNDKLNDEAKLALYESAVKKFYFANIGFDTDEEFIYRFNAIFDNNITKYAHIYNKVNTDGYDYDSVTRTVKTDKSGKDTLTKKGENITRTEHDGIDEFEKGVMTTSQQDTSNIGDKLTRATPNEKLTVAGESTTTVSDSGSDKTLYGHTVEVTETPNTTDEQSYGSSIDIHNTEMREKLTPSELSIMYINKSVEEEFACLFENLFMGVF